LVPSLARYAQPIAFGLVVAIITYLSLVVGELVPKQLALRNPEQLAALMAPLLQLLARLATPLVRLLGFSSDRLLRLFGSSQREGPEVTEEDVRMLLEQSVEVGTLDPLSEEIAQEVLELASRRVNAIMTPRHEISWLNIQDDPATLQANVLNSGYSRFPVADGELEKVIGVVLAKDLLRQQLAGQPLDLRAILRPALYVPETTPAPRLIERFRIHQTKLALVIDEYGGVEGLVTLNDVSEAILGEMPDIDEPREVEAVKRDDGSWLIDGMYPVEELVDLFKLHPPNAEQPSTYQTISGLAMHQLDHIPLAGERFLWQGLQIEIVDMDGRRVDKVLVTVPSVEGPEIDSDSFP
jgi:putative hemolysin